MASSKRQDFIVQRKEIIMTNEKLSIGIILGSTRLRRVNPQVGDWIKEIADECGDANYEIVDIVAYNLLF